jgi:hypothetical protein
MTRIKTLKKEEKREKQNIAENCAASGNATASVDS